MEKIDALKQACLEMNVSFETISKRGRPSVEAVAVRKRAEEILSSSQQEIIPEKVVYPSTKQRIAIPLTKPLHDCTFDVDLAKVSMKYFDDIVPAFLKSNK